MPYVASSRAGLLGVEDDQVKVADIAIHVWDSLQAGGSARAPRDEVPVAAGGGAGDDTAPEVEPADGV